MSKNPQSKIFNRLWNKLRRTDSPKKLEAVDKIVDKILDSQDFDVDKLINPIAAVDKNIPEVDEQREKKISIVFEKYNQKQCELCKLDQTLARALTSKLKHLTSITIKDLPSSGLIRDDVQEGGEYEALYKNLEPDITLKEIQFAEEGRFFGFFKNEFFSLITVWVKHPNLR